MTDSSLRGLEGPLSEGARMPLDAAARKLGWPPSRLAAWLRVRGCDEKHPRWVELAALIGEGFNRSPGCVHGACDEPRASREDWP